MDELRFVIDRFEGNYAVIESIDRKVYNIPKEILGGFKEGDSIIITKEKNINDKLDSMFVD